MSLLTVGELLREADQQVRELTFEATYYHAEGLLTGWGEFLAAAAAVAATLPARQPRQDLDELLAAWQWNPRDRPPVDTRLVTATTALQEVATLTGGRDLVGAPDLGQVAGHLSAIMCVGAHAIAASIRLYLDQTARASQQGRAAAQVDATSRLPRFVFTRLLQRVERAEELTLIGLAQAGRASRPSTPPTAIDQLEGTTATWAQVAALALTAETPPITDLRTIARVNALLSTHTRHLSRVCPEVGALTPFQEAELRPSLEAAGRAWSAADRDWHPAMDDGTRAHFPELTQAGIDVVQGWSTITHRGQRWATGAEISAQHNLGDLLELTAQLHRRASLLARRLHRRHGRVARRRHGERPSQVGPTGHWPTRGNSASTPERRVSGRVGVRCRTGGPRRRDRQGCPRHRHRALPRRRRGPGPAPTPDGHPRPRRRHPPETGHHQPATRPPRHHRAHDPEVGPAPGPPRSAPRATTRSPPTLTPPAGMSPVVPAKCAAHRGGGGGV